MGIKQSKNPQKPLQPFYPPEKSKQKQPPSQMRPPTRMQTGLDGVDFQKEYQDKTQISCIQARIKVILKE